MGLKEGEGEGERGGGGEMRMLEREMCAVSGGVEGDMDGGGGECEVDIGGRGGGGNERNLDGWRGGRKREREWGREVGLWEGDFRER